MLRAANAYRAPFFLSGMARGALPVEHPGRFCRVRKRALKSADVVFVLGTPFDFRVDYGRSGTWNPDVRVVQELEVLARVGLVAHVSGAAPTVRRRPRAAAPGTRPPG